MAMAGMITISNVGSSMELGQIQHTVYTYRAISNVFMAYYAQYALGNIINVLESLSITLCAIYV